MSFMPLNQYILNIVDVAQKSIAQKYPDEDSIAKKMVLNELETIVSADKSFEEKIADIYRTFPHLTAYLIQSAENGDADAQFTLASAYLYGYGVPRDRKEASKWCRAAAEQGNAWAQMALGKGSRNDEISIFWLTKAAEQGLAEAQYWLADKYEHLANGFHRIDADGNRYDEDCPIEDRVRYLSEAVKWYRASAVQGNDSAQFFLGGLYFNGNGVEKDIAEGVKWWRKAAEQGDTDAQYNLGLCYCNGDGVEKDVVEAVKWWREAAEQGYSMAEYNLAACYFHGEGVEQSMSLGLEWLHKAADHGLEEAIIALNNMGKRV